MGTGGQTLIVVESPAKAKSIRKYLDGMPVVIEATVGHFNDLAKEDLIDRESWEEDYVLDPNKAARIQQLRKLVHSGRIARVLLASDPDREGEAIAWHAARAMAAPRGVTVERIEFHEVSKTAIVKAMQAPRAINIPRVDAQRARRVLDRVVGYDVSGLVRAVNAKSAGRVQSAALHVLTERERAILAFVPQDFWTLTAEYTLLAPDGMPLEALLTDAGSLVAHRSAGGIEPEDAALDADDATEEMAQAAASSNRIRAVRFLRADEAERASEALKERPHVVRAATTRETKRKPFPPYTTTTFASDAFRKFGIKTEQAMALAQRGFEGGLWTYHRTDSVHLSDEAVQMFRARIQQKHPEVLPDTPPRYVSKASAQEAHEALRITGFDVSAARFQDVFAEDAAVGRHLWLMIAARCLASQCLPAVFDKTLIDIAAGDATLMTEGQILKKPGFLVYWGEYAEVDTTILPVVEETQRLEVVDVPVAARKTSPPPRYDEASFNSKLEKSGIGRPSTLASILRTLRARTYVADLKIAKKTVLQPTSLGLTVDEVLMASFPTLVTPDYTAEMEAALDEIAQSKLGRVTFLDERFYRGFREQVAEARGRIARYASDRGIQATSTRGDTARPGIGKTCPKCEEHELVLVEYVPKGKKAKKTLVACGGRCGFAQDKRTTPWRVGGCAVPGCGGTLVEHTKRDGAGTYWRCAKCNAFGQADGGGTTSLGPSRPCPRCADHPVMIRYQQHPGTAEAAAEAESSAPTAGTRKKAGAKSAGKADAKAHATGRAAKSGGASAPRSGAYDRCSVCKYTLDASVPLTDEECPSCGARLALRTFRFGAKAGEAYQACTGYPDCTFTQPLPAMPAGATTHRPAESAS